MDEPNMVSPFHFIIGRYYKRDGKVVRLMSGNWLSGGRLSNFWTWRVVNDDGLLTDEVIRGYGCRMEEIKVKETITIEILEG